jgi:hypothetical protein
MLDHILTDVLAVQDKTNGMEDIGLLETIDPI